MGTEGRQWFAGLSLLVGIALTAVGGCGAANGSGDSGVDAGATGGTSSTGGASSSGGAGGRGGSGSSGAGGTPDLRPIATALCDQNCQSTQSLACSTQPSQCSGVCVSLFLDAGACKPQFVDLVACMAPRPASDFQCGCCGWVLPHQDVCKTARAAFEMCTGHAIN